MVRNRQVKRMILFSTKLQTKETLTKEAFLRLVSEWNGSSAYPENIVPGVPRGEEIRWDGDGPVRFGTDRLSLEVVEYPERKIVAVRHEKITADGITWDTDFVLNLAEHQLAIRLDRTYSEDALIMNGAFSTPHFITLLIEQQYLADDNGLPILRTPGKLSDAGDFPAQDDEGCGRYRLPLVVVKPTASGELPLAVDWLASRLKGAAHVLVDEEREEFGAVHICYPTATLAPRRFGYRSATGNRQLRLDKVVKNVISYWNSQRMDLFYTWQGVANALLRDRLEAQRLRQQEAEEAQRSAQAEVDQVYEAFDEDLKALQRKLEELTRANDALTMENSVLRSRLNLTADKPILYQGDEEDFYPEEIKDMILGALEDALSGTEASTRRADVLADVLQNNEFKHLSEQRRQRVKALFRGYKNVSSAMKQELSDLGISISEDGKHYKLTYRDDPRYMVTIGKTPSDNRAGNNNAALVNKVML